MQMAIFDTMVFNTAVFGVFLVIVFFLYWKVLHRNLRIQNIFLLIISYIFYGWWDWRFLGLLALSTTIDYFIGIAIEDAKNPRKRKWLLLSTLSLNLGILGYFKYAGFFIDSMVDVFALFDVHLARPTLEIILPIGLSFYTFQELSYTIDIYRGKMNASRDPINFFAYVSFFPQLVAGPIERATNLLPQFAQARVFDSAFAVSGLRLMLWGFFKKVVVADNLGRFVDSVYGTSEITEGSTWFLATALFIVQVYCDFSGYTDIARGCARLFGFRLMLNFDRPLLAPNFRDFWRRWHISLTNWFRDYIYYPLGGNQRGTIRTCFNLITVFTISGLWHGADLKYVFWGALTGVLSCVEILNPFKIKLPYLLAVFVVMCMNVLAFVFFRSLDFEQAGHIVSSVFSTWHPQDALLHLLLVYKSPLLTIVVFVLVATMLVIEYYQSSLKTILLNASRPVRWSVYYAFILIIIFCGAYNNAPHFVYFQF